MKVIGIDLDNTLAEYERWQGVETIGPPKTGADNFLRILHDAGWTICLWTTRARVYVLHWLDLHNLTNYIDYVNDSPYPCEDHKRNFDIYLGDEALRFTGDYETALTQITNIALSQNAFDRVLVESDRNPSLYYQGTGKVYLDIFNDLTSQLWSKRIPKRSIAFLTLCSHAKPYSKSWIHCCIRERLFHDMLLDKIDYIHISSAGIIPHDATKEPSSIINRYDWNSAEAPDDTIKLHKLRIAERLNLWYDITGKYYNAIYTYLRPNGNTFQAIQTTTLPLNIIPVQPLPSPPWLDFPDVDDCLANPINLAQIAVTIKGG